MRCDSPSSRQRVLRSLCCPRSLVTVWISYDSITIRVTWQARPFKLGAGLGAGLGYDQGCYNSSIRLQSGNLLAAVVASMKHAVVVAIAEIHCDRVSAGHVGRRIAQLCHIVFSSTGSGVSLRPTNVASNEKKISLFGIAPADWADWRILPTSSISVWPFCDSKGSQKVSRRFKRKSLPFLCLQHTRS